MLTRARPDVDNLVRRVHRVLIVLDDDQRIAEVTKPFQRIQQPVVIPLMKPDARLIEDIKHADKTGADLRREPDTLRLPAGKRARCPR